MAEPTVTQLVTTTLNNYHRTLADNVANSNAVTALLRQGGRIRVIEGGKAIACPLTYAEETFSWYSGTELLSRAVKETISEADYAPANAVASVTLSGPDLAKNRGRERILNLLGRQDGQRRSDDGQQHHQGHLWRRHRRQVVRRPQGNGHRRRHRNCWRH